jgi:hypothetical protein
MYMNIEWTMQLWSNPLAFCFPFPILFCPPFVSLYLLGTLLAVIGSCPPRSQVARKLISPFPSPSPYTPYSKIPTPWGFPELNIHFTRTTFRTLAHKIQNRKDGYRGGKARGNKTGRIEEKSRGREREWKRKGAASEFEYLHKTLHQMRKIFECDQGYGEIHEKSRGQNG